MMVRMLRDGRAAEWWAGLWLRLRGWRILGRRVRTPAGEIDIIARRGRRIVFVEVKQRPTREEALSALRPRQQRRLVRAAACWLGQYPAASYTDMRFDLVIIYEKWRIEHIKDVIRAGDAGLP